MQTPSSHAVLRSHFIRLCNLPSAEQTRALRHLAIEPDIRCTLTRLLRLDRDETGRFGRWPWNKE